jgi:Kef-type K+ transport system membrane component KefB
VGEIHHLLVQLFVIFVASQVGAEVAQRLKAPSVVGEIAAGVLVGPSVLAWVPLEDGHAPLPFEVLAEVGVVFLMFSVGLETKLSSLRHLGKVATQVAILGVVIPFGIGFAWAASRGYPIAKQAFIGTAFVATSVAITARVLRDLGALKRKEARVILAAAVLDDILAMLLLGAVAAFQAPAGTEPGSSVGLKLFVLALQTGAFLVALTILLPKFMKRHHRIIEVPISPHSPFVLSVVLCLGCAVLANQIGLAAIIGAFLAGTLLAEVGEKYGLDDQFRPLLGFLAPFFFVVTGMKVDLAVFGSWALVGTALLVTLLAIIGKVVGCGLGSWSLGRRAALAIGVGMAPRGEVGIIIAALGLSHGVFNKEVYAIIIAMALLTSLFAPPVLAMLLRKPQTQAEPG